MTIDEISKKFGLSQDTLRYYERVGAIPSIGRTKGGIRNYQEEDLKWIQMAICLRNAGVSIDAIVEYVRLYQQGEDTFEKRRKLLDQERECLYKQKERLEKAITLLNQKISRYEIAIETGILYWDEGE